MPLFSDVDVFASPRELARGLAAIEYALETDSSRHVDLCARATALQGELARRRGAGEQS